MVDEKDKKWIAEAVAVAVNNSMRLQSQDRGVSARECEVKHGQVMSTMRSQTRAMEAQTTKMNEIHDDVKGMKKELSDTTRKINGHVAWHDGIKEEKTDAGAKKSQWWNKVGNIAKWAAVVVGVVALAGKMACDSMTIQSMATDMKKADGYAETEANP